MVGGVFSQCLTATGNPAAENTKHNARNSQDYEDKENRLGFIEVKQLTHPSNHLGEELTDLGKQSSDNRSSSALKSSSFHKKYLWYLSRTEQENQHREDSGEDNKIADLGNSENTETVLQRQNCHQLMRPQIAFLIQVTVVMKTRTTSKAETQACGLRT